MRYGQQGRAQPCAAGAALRGGGYAGGPRGWGREADGHLGTFAGGRGCRGRLLPLAAAHATKQHRAYTSLLLLRRPSPQQLLPAPSALPTWLVVRVPVLSEQMTVVQPRVSTLGSFLRRGVGACRGVSGRTQGDGRRRTTGGLAEKRGQGLQQRLTPGAQPPRSCHRAVRAKPRARAQEAWH